MKYIIHLAPDEKFIKEAYKSFNNIQGTNSEFIIFSDNEKLSKIDFESKHYRWNYLANSKFIEHLNKADLIFIHFLDEKYYDILNNKSLTSKIIWIGWGGDYYWLIDTLPRFNILRKYTRLTFSQNRWLHIFSPLVKKALRKWRSKKIETLNRVHFFAPVLREDYELIKKNYKEFSPKFVNWNYGCIEDIVAGYENFTINDNNILIGNSATRTNNHIDVFNKIKNIQLGTKSLIIPLNYGDKNYGDRIAQIAYENFGNKSQILKEFLEYPEYLKLIQSCGSVILGHIRQQALWNILFMLYIGARIYFFKDSVTYNYLVSNSIEVFTIEELSENPELLDIKLSTASIIKQRQALLQIWGKELNRKNTQNVINLLDEKY